MLKLKYIRLDKNKIYKTNNQSDEINFIKLVIKLKDNNLDEPI